MPTRFYLFTLMVFCLLTNVQAQDEDFVLNRLSPDLPNGGEVPFDFREDPIDECVGFRTGPQPWSLWIAPLDNSEPAIQVSLPNAGSNGVDFNFKWDEDGSLLAFLADSRIDGVYELFVTNKKGELRNLTPDLSAGETVDLGSFLFVAGDRIAFEATIGGVDGIYSVPTAGGAITKLNTGITAGGDANLMEDSKAQHPNLSFVTYSSRVEGNDNEESLYIVPFDGSSPPVRITPDPNNFPMEDVGSSIFVNGGTEIMYAANYGIPNGRIGNIFKAPLSGSENPTLLMSFPTLNPPNFGGSTNPFTASPNGRDILIETPGPGPLRDIYTLPATADANNQFTLLFDVTIANDDYDFIFIDAGDKLVILTGNRQQIIIAPSDASSPNTNFLQLSGDDEIVGFGNVPGGEYWYYSLNSSSGDKLVLVPVNGGDLREFDLPEGIVGELRRVRSEKALFTPPLPGTNDQELFTLDLITGLYERVPIDYVAGGGADGGDVTLTDDSRFIIFRGDILVDGKDELFSFDCDPQLDQEEIPAMPWALVLIFSALVFFLGIRQLKFV